MNAKKENPLDSRICDLGLDLQSSLFAPAIRELDAELERADIAMRPRFYLSTDYGCIVRSVDVGLLFMDGFPALRRIARRIGMRVRRPAQILMTLRHEAGHAFCYGHRLYATRRFRDLFGVQGDFYRSYPDRWWPSPAGRARVARGELIQVYASRHADEDFAICFQTWLAEPAGCVERYVRRPRIAEKLVYVADAVRLHGHRPVTRSAGPPDDCVDRLRPTLRRWLDRVRREQDYNLFPQGPVA